MNIIYHLINFPKLSESFVLNEIYELRQRGHNVAVVAYNKPDKEITHKEYDSLDINVYYPDEPILADGTELLTPKVSSVLTKRLGDAGLRIHLGRLIKAKRIADFVETLGWTPDIIHGHFATKHQFNGIYAATLLDIPYSVTVHAYDIFVEKRIATAQTVLSEADHCVTISEYNRRYLRDELGVTTPISIVPAGLRYSKFSPTESKNPGRILTIARFVEKKGISYGIEAVAQLIEEGYDVEYHIIGSGRLESELKQLVEDLSIEDHVTFLGNVTDEQLSKELDQAEMFLLPCVVASDGDRDAMPVVLKEAMAMRTACVSTTVSAIPELITDGETGLLVEPRDSSALATAIQSLLDDPELCEAIGRVAREHVKEYDYSTLGRKLVDTFSAIKG